MKVLNQKSRKFIPITKNTQKKRNFHHIEYKLIVPGLKENIVLERLLL